MTLQAELQEFGVHQILNLVQAGRKTGRLRVEGVEGEVSLYVREGVLEAVEAPGRVSDLLSYVVADGKLRSEEAREISAGSVAEMAVLLVETHRLARDDVLQALRQHHREVACSLFTWTEGVFVFEPGAEPPESVLSAPQPLEHVLIEGDRRIRQARALRERVPSLDVGLRLPRGGAMPAGHVDLTADEWLVVQAASSGQTLRSVQRAHRLSDYRLRRAAVQLAERDLLEIEEPPAYPAQPPAEVRKGLWDRLRGR